MFALFVQQLATFQLHNTRESLGDRKKIKVIKSLLIRNDAI